MELVISVWLVALLFIIIIHLLLINKKKEQISIKDRIKSEDNINKSLSKMLEILTFTIDKTYKTKGYDSYIVDVFRKGCRDWLIPLGYTETFSDNHPNIANTIIVFYKDNISITCRKRYGREECYGSKNITINTTYLTVQTGNWKINSNIELSKIVEDLKIFEERWTK